MKKPLIASSFFTFPRFLVWGLPLGLLLTYTWVFQSGGPTIKLPAIKINPLKDWLSTTEERVVSKVCMIQCLEMMCRLCQFSMFGYVVSICFLLFVILLAENAVQKQLLPLHIST